jgi:hypothetical protein
MAEKLYLSEAEVAELWKQRFFEAQAGMEKFLVEKYGYTAIDEWIQRNAEVFRDIQDNSNPGAAGLIERIAKQAECYKSDYSIEQLDSSCASMTIFHCGIWDYRERARQRGVKLTFDSPCTRYCTKLTTALIESKGYQASHELTEVGPHHGCRWKVTSKSTLRDDVNTND